MAPVKKKQLAPQRGLKVKNKVEKDKGWSRNGGRLRRKIQLAPNGVTLDALRKKRKKRPVVHRQISPNFMALNSPRTVRSPDASTQRKRKPTQSPARSSPKRRREEFLNNSIADFSARSSAVSPAISLQQKKRKPTESPQRRSDPKRRRSATPSPTTRPGPTLNPKRKRTNATPEPDKRARVEQQIVQEVVRNAVANAPRKEKRKRSSENTPKRSSPKRERLLSLSRPSPIWMKRPSPEEMTIPNIEYKRNTPKIERKKSPQQPSPIWSPKSPMSSVIPVAVRPGQNRVGVVPRNSIDNDPIACRGVFQEGALNLANPPACFKRHLAEALAPVVEKRKQLLAQGKQTCGKYMMLSPYQIALKESARAMFSQGIVSGGSRGCIVWASTGAGKTLSTLCLAVAAHTSGRPLKFALLSTPNNNRQNSGKTYAALLAQYFPDKARAFGMPEYDTSDGSFKDYGNANPIPPKKLQLINYGELSKLKKLLEESDGKDLVIVCDESQNIFVPSGIYQQEKFLQTFEYLKNTLAKDSAKKHCYTFFMSATPSGGEIKNWFKSADCVSPLGAPKIPPNSSPTALRGLVTYAEVRDDPAVSGTLIGGKGTNFASKVLNKTYEMGGHYYAAYLKAVDGSSLAYSAAQPGEYLKLHLQKSLFLTKTECGTILNTTEQDKAGRVFKISNTTAVMSHKMAGVLRAATKAAGKQYIYVNNTTAARALGKALEAAYGYERVKVPKNAKEYLASKPKKLRYMLMQTGVVGEGGDKQEDTDIEILKDIAGDTGTNLYGDQCKIIIASGGYYEGLSINALRGVHIVSPLPTADQDMQALGRSLRACGHSELPPEMRNCVIVRYFSVPPTNFDARAVAKHRKMKGAAAEKAIETMLRAHRTLANAFDSGRPSADIQIFEKAQERASEVYAFEECVRKVAYDCSLLKPAMGYSHACSGGSNGNNALCGKIRKDPVKVQVQTLRDPINIANINPEILSSPKEFNAWQSIKRMPKRGSPSNSSARRSPNHSTNNDNWSQARTPGRSKNTGLALPWLYVPPRNVGGNGVVPMNMNTPMYSIPKKSIQKIVPKSARRYGYRSVSRADEPKRSAAARYGKPEPVELPKKSPHLPPEFVWQFWK